MQKKTIETKIEIYNFEELGESKQTLINKQHNYPPITHSVFELFFLSI